MSVGVCIKFSPCVILCLNVSVSVSRVFMCVHPFVCVCMCV